MIGFKILKNKKLNIDTVENPEGLLYIDIIAQDQSSGRITDWFSLNKEQLEEVVRVLQRKLVEL